MTTADIKWFKDFLQQVTRLPVEYRETHLPPLNEPAPVKSVPAKKASTAPVSKKLTVSLKKLGGAGAASQVLLPGDGLVSALRAEAAKIYGVSVSGFSLMYKGRSLTDDGAKVSEVVHDLATAVYVSIKSGATVGKTQAEAKTGPVLEEGFWSEFRTLLGKHVPAEAAEKLSSRFKQEHSKWI